MLYIVRHCQTDWNKLDKVQGRPDVPLNDDGRQQALRLAREFAGRNFAEVYSSPLSRAVETARLITGRVPVTDERLSERLFGKLEGQSKKCTEFIAFWNSDNELKVPGTETVEQTVERVKEVIGELVARSREKDVLAVTHGGVLMALNYVLKGRPASGNLTEYLPDNADIIIL